MNVKPHQCYGLGPLVANVDKTVDLGFGPGKKLLDLSSSMDGFGLLKKVTRKLQGHSSFMDVFEP